MSRKFYATRVGTGERWRPDPKYTHQYLVMYDSGYLAVVTEDFYTSIEPLCRKTWQLEFQR